MKYIPYEICFFKHLVKPHWILHPVFLNWSTTYFMIGVIQVNVSFSYNVDGRKKVKFKQLCFVNFWLMKAFSKEYWLQQSTLVPAFIKKICKDKNIKSRWKWIQSSFIFSAQWRQRWNQLTLSTWQQGCQLRASTQPVPGSINWPWIWQPQWPVKQLWIGSKYIR